MESMENKLQELARQEAQYIFGSFSNSDAFELGNIIRDMALAEGLPVAIDISRGGQILYHVGLEGSAPDNDVWIKRKINTVTRFGHSSFYMATELALEGKTIDSKYLLDPREYAACGGCFPIKIKETGTVGTVTVSGLADWADHELVIRGLKLYFERRV